MTIFDVHYVEYILSSVSQQTRRGGKYVIQINIGLKIVENEIPESPCKSRLSGIVGILPIRSKLSKPKQLLLNFVKDEISIVEINLTKNL